MSQPWTKDQINEHLSELDEALLKGVFTDACYTEGYDGPDDPMWIEDVADTQKRYAEGKLTPLSAWNIN